MSSPTQQKPYAFIWDKVSCLEKSERGNQLLYSAPPHRDKYPPPIKRLERPHPEQDHPIQ